MLENPNYYAILPAQIRYDSDLNPTAKLLYGEITSLCSKTGECWASNEYFASLYNCTTRTIRRYISQLAKKNYIVVKFVYKDKSNEIEKRTISIGGDNTDHRCGNSCPGGEDKTGQSGGDRNVLDNNINNTNNTSINNMAKKDESTRRCITENDWKLKFEKFYKMYPKKQKKSETEKWFFKNNPSNELFQLIILKLSLFCKTSEWKKENGKYIPYPTSWLNQKRWEDDVPLSEEELKKEENAKILEEIEAENDNRAS